MNRRSGARRFVLQRDTDASGVSGTGAVADGVCFPDGVCVLRWAVGFRSTAVYDELSELVAIHGHSGMTRIVWIDK